MKTYMTDTHSLLWAFARLEKLGSMARRTFNEIAKGVASLLVPVIVVAELIFTVENKSIRANLGEILNLLQNSPNIEFVDRDLQSVLRLRELAAIPEMHDRMIVAEAIRANAALITCDKAITESGLVEVVW